MPNWVHHRLTITGPATERERFTAECFSVAGDGMRFDFDKLIPLPEHIKDGLDRPTIFPQFPDWYTWRCENWGTRSDAQGTDFARRGDAICLSFDTAWAPPIPIFNEIAKRFPKLRIEGSLIDEMYNFAANIHCENGSVEFEDRTEEIQAEFEAAMTAAERTTAVKPPPSDHGDDFGDLPF